jgi:hypothetical protein
MRNSFHSYGLYLYIIIDRTLMIYTIFSNSGLERQQSSNSLSETRVLFYYSDGVSSSSIPRILLSTKLKKSYSFLDLFLHLS